MIMGGSKLIALHKGRYWRVGDGLRMDIGVFVAGLEYITGREALIMGKPSPHFFNMALEDIDLHPGEVAMLGDDIVSDVGGAQEMGIKGVLVMTGKYSKEHDHHYDVEPDIILPSVAELKSYL
jgi:HAD superfamily hydrolase (TIGR01458 family)